MATSISNVPEADEVCCGWARKLQDFLPVFFDTDELLTQLYDKAVLMLHGSTTMGINDEHSDLDVWFLLPGEQLAVLDARSETRFFEFVLDGKKGHALAEPLSEFISSVERCHMDTVYQLRKAVVLHDVGGTAKRLIATARQPMREETMRAHFFYH